MNKELIAELVLRQCSVEAAAKAHCDFFGGEGWWDTGLIADTKPKAMAAMEVALRAALNDAYTKAKQGAQ
jgi:hypothetical protein